MGDKQLWEGGKLSGVTCIADCAVANNLLSSDNPIVDRPNVMELVELMGRYTQRKVLKYRKIEETQHIQPIKVKDRLRECLFFWKKVLQPNSNH